MSTMRKLKQAIAATRRDIEVEESKPGEMIDSGSVSLYLNEDGREQFRESTLTLVGVYFWSLPGSRAEAIADLIERLAAGFEPMTEATAWECGVEL